MSDSDKLAASDAPRPDADDESNDQIWTEFGFDGSGPATKDAASDDHQDETPDDAEPPEDDAPDDDAPDPSLDDDDAPTDTAPTKRKDETLAEQIARQDNHIKRQNGRLSAQAREIAKLRSQVASAKPKSQGSPSENGDDPSQRRKEKLSSVKEEFPEIAGPMAEELESLQAELAELRSATSQRAEDERKQAETRLSEIYQEQESVFLSEHDDGFAVIEKNADTFKGWIQDQPKYLRDLLQENAENIVNGIGAALLVSKFKEALASANGGQESNAGGGNSNSRQTNRRQRQLEGARSTSGRRTGATQARLPDDADPESLWAEMHQTGLIR